MERVRLGIIGLGRVFRLGYLPWLERYLDADARVELAAMSDINVDLGRRCSRIFRCPFFDEPVGLLSPGLVDAVVVNTPTWTHEELVVQAAGHGLHVLCEKPMAATSEACERMLAACRESGVTLLISFMRRFNKGFQKVRELIRRGDIGEVVELSAEWPYFIPDIDSEPYRTVLEWVRRLSGFDIPQEYGAWRLKDPRVGGGDFLDHGPHIIDFFRWVAGDVVRLSGYTRVLVPGRNEDYTKCVLRVASGATGYIKTTLYDFKSGLVGKVYGSAVGTEGRIDFVLPNTDRFKPIRYVTLYREPGSTGGRLLRGLGLARGRKIRLEKNLVFRDQLEYFVSAVTGDLEPHPVFGDEFLAATGEDGLYTVRVVERCYDSASRSQEWLEVD